MNNIKKKLLKIKNMGAIGFCKFIRDYLKRPFIKPIHNIRWSLFNLLKRKGITDKQYSHELIVSLTTYPKRINSVVPVIQSLLMQSLKPNRIILWLANEQFKGKENELPNNLLQLKKFGLSILWCDDIRSYKKLIPAIEMFPNALIITADDDLYYHPKMVQRLYEAYTKEPGYIHCHRVTKFYIEDAMFKTVPGSYDVYKKASYLHKLTGGSGSCYPPNYLYKDICNRDIFMRLAPTNDDIWFWFMAILGEKKCNVVKHNCAALYFVDGSQDDALSHINDNGEKLFWKQFEKLLAYYPQVKDILISEFSELNIRS